MKGVLKYPDPNTLLIISIPFFLDYPGSLFRIKALLSDSYYTSQGICIGPFFGIFFKKKLSKGSCDYD
jgi:hypothetical protein